MKLFLTAMTLWLLLLYPAASQKIDFATLERGTVTDNEGNVYNTIRFGNTWWMTSNLRTRHYNDGSEILQMTQFINAADETNDWTWWMGAGRWGYTNFNASTCNTYGLLYSWPAANDTKHSGICPEGWMLPDTADWVALGRTIVGADKVINVLETKPTPTGGTETTFLPLYVNDLGQHLKTDNGKVLGTNRYGEPTWLNGGNWPNNPALANECNGAGMNMIPSGTISTSIADFGKAVYYWSPNYVHASLQGAGRRYIYFSSESHNLTIGSFHQANLCNVRAIKRVSTTTAISASMDNVLSIYPNPTTDYIRVSGISGTYRIVSIAGSTLQSGTLGNETTTIPLTGLADGIYLFQAGGFTKKIVKR